MKIKLPKDVSIKDAEDKPVFELAVDLANQGYTLETDEDGELEAVKIPEVESTPTGVFHAIKTISNIFFCHHHGRMEDSDDVGFNSLDENEYCNESWDELCESRNFSHEND